MPSENLSTSLPGMGLTIHRLPGSYSGVYGPVTNQVGVYPWRLWKRDRSWSVQDPPFEKTLPYSDVTSSVKGGYFDYEVVEYPGGLNKPPDRTRFYGNGGTNDLVWAEAHTLTSTTSAKNRVLEAMQDAKWNAALFAAEANKTADLIFATAKRLAGAYRAVRTGRWGRACDLLSIRSPSGPRNEWLAYRYGWTPLLGDVVSAAEAAASTLVERPPRLKVLKRGSSTLVTTVEVAKTFPTIDTVQNHSGTSSSLRYRRLRTVETQTKAWLEVEASNSVLMRMEQFGLANPAALAWELIPFSFVADWFVGVGDYLNAQTALTGLTVVDGGTSQLSTRTSIGSATSVVTGAYNRSVNGMLPFEATSVSRKYSRLVWDGAPPPIRVSAELNLKRILDGAALITAVFGNRK